MAAVDSKPTDTSTGGENNYAFSITAEGNQLTADHWVFDSAATSHMTPHRALIENPRPIDRVVTVGGGYQLQATEIGSAIVTTLLSDGTTRTITLKDTLVVPKLQFSLLSWPRMADGGAYKTGDKQGTIVYRKGERILETVQGPVGRLQVVRTPKSLEEIAAVSVMQLHRKLAHLPPSSFPALQGSVGLPPIPAVNGPFDCPSCNKAKFTRTIPKRRETKAPHPFHSIYSDICGPFSVKTPGGSRYFISAIDESTHYTEVRYLRTREEAPKALIDMIRQFERQHDTKVKSVQTDNAGELTSNWFEKGLADLGIKHNLSIAYIHETNGIAERFNRTITASAHALLYDSGLPLSLWAEAVTHATYTKNRMPHVSLGGKSPLEVTEGRKPNLSNLQPFGSPAYVFIPEERRKVGGKLKERSEEGYLVGYTDQSNRYRFWIPDQMRVTISRDFRPRLATPAVPEMQVPTKATTQGASVSGGEKATRMRTLTTDELHQRFPSLFTSPPEQSSLESSSPPSLLTSGTIPGGYPEAEEESVEGVDVEGEPPYPPVPTDDTITKAVPPPPATGVRTTRSGRETRRPKRLIELAEIALMVSEDPDMPSVSQALGGPESREWQVAMEKEIDAIERYDTWEEMLAPETARFVDTKWVLKKKRNEKGELIKYKARLNARGFTQVPGLDFDETFAAVVRTDTIRLLLAHAIQENLYTAQYDVEAAYLNAPLEEEHYLKPPPGVNVTPGRVLRLRKTIYGLKQSARAWAEVLKGVLAERGFQRLEADPALYINLKKGEFAAVHVDDILYVSKHKTDFGEWLGSHFTINDLGRPRYLLSIELD